MTRARQSSGGFSLLEVLVVLAIVSMVAGGIVLTRPAADQPVRLEAAKLNQSLRSLSDRAIFTGQTHALDLTADGYRARMLDNGSWIALAAPDRKLPRGVSMRPDSDILQTDEGVWTIQFNPAGLKPAGSIFIRGRQGNVTVFADPAENQAELG